MNNGEYVDLYGEIIALDGLDAEERGLVKRLRRRARAKPSWCDFRNIAVQAVAEFYDARGVSRQKTSRGPVFRIALDLGSRLGIAEGKIAPPKFDYRAQLERLMLEFPTRAAFCKAAGISRDMLSHVLAGRKDLSLQRLCKALERLGYRLSFVPAARAKRTG
jgi:transcriptional regulator with XRE-family HTH domain